MKHASGFLFAFTLALACICSAASASSETNPFALAKLIHDEGAKAVVRGMSESEWNDVLTHIDSGNPAWVALVPKLAEGTDSGNSEDLGIGLAYALPKNPRAVLRAIDPNNGPVLGVNRLCSAPFIEDTVPDIPAYIKRAKAALDKVRDSSLQDVKKACLAELAKP
ncbi:hypothetical protein [Paraburkholderia susongensis]|uniref:Uncharacterized protein n=1 Tax=Paraburkholderia susongensis TaxID=1515439 RepID=A0A1X7KZN4_9BURK|nr:hypothetical protein [Paraburkholderia susongensis]SMG46502.1 hypothetical protein SAMN06265784_104574 [Paraburkholderia susongensis]